jgi:HEAT repeat protein
MASSEERLEIALKKLAAARNASERAAAVTSLGLTFDPQAASPLIDVLHNDSDWEVRTAAYLALALIPDETALMALIRFYASLAAEEPRADIDYEIFGDALPGSATRLGERAFPVLREALADANPIIRETAVWLLADMDHVNVEQAVAGLAQAMRDDDSNVRSFAIYFLREMKHPEAEAALRAAGRDKPAGKK